jgi:hypothetical protein
MVRAITIRILRQILLVVVGTEVFSLTEMSQLAQRGHVVGRLSVDVVVDPPVDRHKSQTGRSVSSPPCGSGLCEPDLPELNRTYTSRYGIDQANRTPAGCSDARRYPIAR